MAYRHQESVTVYTDGFRAYELLDEADRFTREYLVHGEGEYVDGDVQVNTHESHTSLRVGGVHRIEASPKQAYDIFQSVPTFAAKCCITSAGPENNLRNNTLHQQYTPQDRKFHFNRRNRCIRCVIPPPANHDCSVDERFLLRVLLLVLSA
mgnify:CR=1 FL=1